MEKETLIIEETAYFKQISSKLAKQFKLDNLTISALLATECYYVQSKNSTLQHHKVINRASQSVKKIIMEEKGYKRTNDGYQLHHLNIEQNYLQNIEHQPIESADLDERTAKAIELGQRHYRKEQAAFIKEVLTTSANDYINKYGLNIKTFNNKLNRVIKASKKKEYKIENKAQQETKHNIELLAQLDTAINNDDLPAVYNIILTNDENDMIISLLDNITHQSQFLIDLLNNITTSDTYTFISNIIQTADNISPITTVSTSTSQPAKSVPSQLSRSKQAYMDFISGQADNIEITHADDCQLLADPNLFHVFGSSTVLIVDRNGKEIKQYDAILYAKLMQEVGLQ